MYGHESSQVTVADYWRIGEKLQQTCSDQLALCLFQQHGSLWAQSSPNRWFEESGDGRLLIRLRFLFEHKCHFTVVH